MERQQDIVYMQQQAAQLDKQERERQQLLEKVKAVQVSAPCPPAHGSAAGHAKVSRLLHFSAATPPNSLVAEARHRPLHLMLQNRQAEDAKQRPPFKRWVAEEIIEKQFQ